MARPRIPVAVKRLQGNRGKRWQDLEAGIILPPEMPEPPAHLEEEAKVIFIETGKLLFAIGTLTKCDVNILARYASNSVLVRKAHKALSISPAYGLTNGKVFYHPAVKILREFEGLLTKFETEMGMTAAARSKINLGGGTKKPDDSFAQKFLQG